MQSLKDIFQALFSLHPKQLFQLVRLGIQHPLLCILTWYATFIAYRKASKIYPKKHSKNGKENAFRHALWTSMIANFCTKITSPQKAMDFSKKATDLHEDLFPNTPLQRAMDLHNNQIGLMVFQRILKGVHRQFIEKQFLIDELQKMLPNAQLARNLDEIKGDEMIYIEKS